MTWSSSCYSTINTAGAELAGAKRDVPRYCARTSHRPLSISTMSIVAIPSFTEATRDWPLTVKTTAPSTVSPAARTTAVATTRCPILARLVVSCRVTCVGTVFPFPRPRAVRDADVSVAPAAPSVSAEGGFGTSDVPAACGVRSPGADGRRRTDDGGMICLWRNTVWNPCSSATDRNRSARLWPPLVTRRSQREIAITDAKSTVPTLSPRTSLNQSPAVR
jgi:hypothetical protein